jgi:UDP-glucose 4-epimerase
VHEEPTRAVVTGGAGFIGSHLVDALLARGTRVIVVDNLSTGRRENLNSALAGGAELEVADITDASSMRELVARFVPDAAFHLAAQVDVRRAVREPGFDAVVNVAGTVAMLEAVREAGVPRFVFASTGGAIYGEGAGRDLPLGEEASTVPDSPYGQSKLAAEGYVDFYRRVHGVGAVSLRLGNVYGPRQDPLGEAGVVGIFCGRITAGDPPTVYGDGLQTRDYVYVGDVVAAMLAAEQRLGRGGIEAGSTFNVGTGRQTSVLELADRIAQIAGGERIAPRMAPPREGEVQNIALDSGRAGSELGWSAETGLDAGLRRVLDWVRERASGDPTPRTG